MTTTIAVVGPAGAGKTSVASHLERAYGARRYAFAAPLKEIARRALDLSHEQVWGSQAQKEAIDPRYGFSPRWFLQRLGTEGVRGVLGEDFWIRMTLELIQRDRAPLAVVEDARFANECAAVRAMHTDGLYPSLQTGFVWRLLPPPGPSASIDDGAHVSECEWREATCDVVIAPQFRGLDQLHHHVDAECARLGLVKIGVLR
jgi:hypothetical protein